MKIILIIWICIIILDLSCYDKLVWVLDSDFCATWQRLVNFSHLIISDQAPLVLHLSDNVFCYS